MPLRKVSFVSGEYYHLYNRGNSKQKIFHDTQDYERFLKLLFLSNSDKNFKIHLLKERNVYKIERGKSLVAIGAYCLMPNHFHILITQPENGNISKFMQKVSTGYVMYYNQKYKRTGTLFEGKFKAEHANEDRYLKYLFSYIHLNPVKIIDPTWKEVGIKNNLDAINFLNQYEYSSLKEYQNKNRVQNAILSKESFPDYFKDKGLHQKEIIEWLLLGLSC